MNGPIPTLRTDDESAFATALLAEVQALGQVSPQTEHTVRAAARAIFAAIDGYLWMIKAHVHSHASHLITPAESAYLRGESYTIDSKGIVKTQAARIPFGADVRFTVALINKLHPDSTATVGEEGWKHLKDSLALRSRIVHPKSIRDLEVSDADIWGVTRGFVWLVKLYAHAFAATEFVGYGPQMPPSNRSKVIAMMLDTAEYTERAWGQLKPKVPKRLT